MNLFGTSVLILGYLGGAILFAQNANRPVATPVSNEINGELPSWLHFSGEERARMENLEGVGFKTVGDLYLLNRLRLRTEVRPLPWIKFNFEAEDSRVFGQNTQPAPASQKEALDLRLGYAEVGSEAGLATLRAGRQDLTFGEGRVLADTNWSNVGRSFDAARLTLRHGRLKVDLFTGVSVKINQVDFDLPTPGAHFHGAYGSLSKLVPNSTIEPYVFWRLEHNCKNESGRMGNQDEKVVGLRWVGKLPLRFDYTAEMVDQVGSNAGDRVRAWAGHWAVGHTLPDPTHRPRVFSELNRASGDANGHDGVHGDFDPLFPSTHDKLGLTDLFTWTNLLHWRSGFEYTIRPPLKVSAAYNSFWLADPRDGLYVGGKAIARSADGSAGTHIGQQADVQSLWTLPGGTQINVGYGRLFPGEFLRRTTAGVPYHIVFCNIAQRF